VPVLNRVGVRVSPIALASLVRSAPAKPGDRAEPDTATERLAITAPFIAFVRVIKS
jgi:hypothetical protein